jgi:hypothetical protein
MMRCAVRNFAKRISRNYRRSGRTAASAADLKFLQRCREFASGTSNRSAARE